MNEGPDATEEALATAAHDLLFPSESEAPLTVYRWPLAGEPSPSALLAHEGRPADTPVESTTVEREMAPLTTAPPGSDETEQALAKRWTALLDTLRRELSDLRVYRVGRVDIDLYVLGRASSGAWLGYRTHVVET